MLIIYDLIPKHDYIINEPDLMLYLNSSATNKQAFCFCLSASISHFIASFCCEIASSLVLLTFGVSQGAGNEFFLLKQGVAPHPASF